MVAKHYIPERGDIVWVNFNPIRGHEQKGKRPALVVSRKEYNAKAGLALLCPITSQEKGYPFEVSVSVPKISGAILADQVWSVDWKERRVSFAAKGRMAILKEVQEKLTLLIG